MDISTRTQEKEVCEDCENTSFEFVFNSNGNYDVYCSKCGQCFGFFREV